MEKPETETSDLAKGIRAVVLDFGGVMTSMTMPERVRPVIDELGISWSALESGFAKYRRLMDADFMSMDEMYELIWADAGIEISPEMQSRVLEEDVASFMKEYRNLRTLEWMRRLKAGGYRLGILSNMSTDFARRFRAAYPEFIALADAMVLSGEVRMFKPQRRIYDLMRTRLGLPAESIVFVDDVEENCRGARDAGWRALRFVSNEQVESAFGKM